MTKNRSQRIRLASPRTVDKKGNQPLRLTPYAWRKLLFLRDLGDTEVGGFGISSHDDLLLVEDIVLVRQVCTLASVKFDDEAVADYFDDYVDLGYVPERFARIWVHTHPGDSASPSSTDEETFARCFGNSDWAVMFILARGGETYARLALNGGPGGELVLPVEIDFSLPFRGSQELEWEQGFLASVSEELFFEPSPCRDRRRESELRQAGDTEELLLDGWSDGPSYDPFRDERLEVTG